MKVIFLDCDGVLANYRSQMMNVSESDSESLIFDEEDGDNKPLEKLCLDHLQWLVASSGAKVVLSTSWRLVPSMRDFLVRVLQMYNIEVIGDTPQLLWSHAGRGGEVKAWLDSHQGDVDGFVIFDDDHETSFQEQNLGSYFVKTELYGDRSESMLDPTLGLTRSKAEEALAILARPYAGVSKEC